MKKIIFIVALVAVMFSGANAERLSQAHKDLSGKLVEILGYQCDSVDNAVRSNYDGSITVYCDGHLNAYVVKKVGGHWTIKVK